MSQSLDILPRLLAGQQELQPARSPSAQAWRTFVTFSGRAFWQELLLESILDEERVESERLDADQPIPLLPAKFDKRRKRRATTGRHHGRIQSEVGLVRYRQASLGTATPIEFEHHDARPDAV